MPSPLDKLNNPIKVEKDNTPAELLVKEMLSIKGIRTKTDLNDGLVVALSKGTIFSKKYKSKTMDMLVGLIAEYRVSRNREGRKEMKEMVRSLANPIEMENPKLSLKTRLFGKE